MHKESEDSCEVTALNGGNMNTPVKRDDIVHRKTTKSSKTIHQLLIHLKEKNITWVPEFLGFDHDGDEMLSFIYGDVPHEMPAWIWEEAILVQIANAMRQFHDATTDFKYTDCHWELPASQPIEVICHNDFAPYNCAFANGLFKGLFDFDVCSPGSRLWDIAYSIYRFVPFMPDQKQVQNDEISPFSEKEILSRADLFLQSYSGKDKQYLYPVNELCRMIHKRLEILSSWTLNFAKETNNQALILNAEMYQRHADWVKKFY